jgi:hypothetical protein
MSTSKETALQGVESALGQAVSQVSATYEACLVDAAGDAAKEADCKAIRDRSLGFAKRAHADMIGAVNLQWPQGS